MLGSRLRALFHAQFCPVQVSPLVQREVKCWGLQEKSREAVGNEEELLEMIPNHRLQSNTAAFSCASGSGAGRGELRAGSPSPAPTVSAVRAWDSSGAEAPRPLSQAFIWHQSPECRGARQRGVGSGPVPSGLVGQEPCPRRCTRRGGCVGDGASPERAPGPTEVLGLMGCEQGI